MLSDGAEYEKVLGRFPGNDYCVCFKFMRVRGALGKVQYLCAMVCCVGPGDGICNSCFGHRAHMYYQTAICMS